MQPGCSVPKKEKKKGQGNGKNKGKEKGEICNESFEDFLISYISGGVLVFCLFYLNFSPQNKFSCFSSWTWKTHTESLRTESLRALKRNTDFSLWVVSLSPFWRVGFFWFCHENLQYPYNAVSQRALYLVLNCVDCIYHQKLFPDDKCKSTLWQYEPNFSPWTWQELQIGFFNSLLCSWRNRSCQISWQLLYLYQTMPTHSCYSCLWSLWSLQLFSSFYMKYDIQIWQ